MSNAVFIIPTGIGASIGGFAGDASPAVKLISKVCPVITNPKTVNAAVFSGIGENILYVEGYSINEFFKEKIALRTSKFNKIGIIFDKAIPEHIFNIHINTINAMKSVYGIDIKHIIVTHEAAGVRFGITEGGFSTGCLENPDTIISAAVSLKNKGVDAIAVVCYFEGSDDADYAGGKGADPVGGVEAVISHLISKELNMPAAHAPAFNEISFSTKIVDKRAASEYITPTFLPCIILGLYNAPRVIDIKEKNPADITLRSINSLILPYNCLGNTAVLKALEKNIPVIAVEENKTVLNITPEALGIEEKVIVVKNYIEAAGYLLALREGIPIDTLTSTIKTGS